MPQTPRSSRLSWDVYSKHILPFKIYPVPRLSLRISCWLLEMQRWREWLLHLVPQERCSRKSEVYTYRSRYNTYVFACVIWWGKTEKMNLGCGEGQEERKQRSSKINPGRCVRKKKKKLSCKGNNCLLSSRGRSRMWRQEIMRVCLSVFRDQQGAYGDAARVDVQDQTSLSGFKTHRWCPVLLWPPYYVSFLSSETALRFTR